MSTSDHPTRRAFLGQAAGASAIGFAAPYVITSGALGGQGRPGANSKISIGCIGLNGQGMYSVKQCMRERDVVISALCDVYKPRLDAAVKHVTKPGKDGKPSPHPGKPYRDFREILARKDIDAVTMAPPPHWHCLMGIMAAEAGKDFYLEKPMTLYPAETRALANAVETHKRITQIGTQIHATDNYRRVVEYIRSGKLGPISLARTFHVQNQGPEGVGDAPYTAPPPDMDWEMWLGPGPKSKYNETLAKSSFYHCSWMDYSGGWTPGMAPHIIDLPIWSLELGCPESVSATGGRFVIKDCGDAYDNHEVLWRWPKFIMTWSSPLVNSYGFDFGHGKPARRRGIYFQGVNGTVLADYGWFKVRPEGEAIKTVNKEGKDTEPPPQTIAKSKGHHREWLDGIKTRTQPLCHVGYHKVVDICSNTSVLAMKLEREIKLDPQTLKIVGDPEAEKASIPVYRDPWKFPSQYL